MAVSPPDPRTLVTPDAFRVKDDLLGFPLASPSRRLAALAVDGVFIGILTLLPGFVLGLVAAALFFRIGRRGHDEERGKGDPMARAFKWTMGCFGAFILLITLTVVVGAVGIFWGGGDRGDPVSEVVDEALEGAGAGRVEGDGIRGLVAGLELGRDFTRYVGADTEEDARRTGLELARRMRSAGVPRREIREALEDQAPEGAWDADELVAGIMAALDEPPTDADTAVAAAPARDTGAASDLPDPEAQGLEASLDEYRDLLARDTLEAAQEARTRALRRYLAGQLAGDSLRSLERAVAAREGELDDLRDDLRDTERELSSAREGSGFMDFIVSISDNLGLTFGWGSVYLTIFLTWWQGQTPGKRLLDIRVLRLDGEPITWFVAFERAGGYAAGVATGLLGFAQVYWDPNRQAIHDKIVGTVVIRDGMDRVTAPWVAPERESPPSAPGRSSAPRASRGSPKRPGDPPRPRGSSRPGGPTRPGGLTRPGGPTRPGDPPRPGGPPGPGDPPPSGGGSPPDRREPEGESEP